VKFQIMQPAVLYINIGSLRKIVKVEKHISFFEYTWR
jgi:hypothetical protein